MQACILTVLLTGLTVFNLFGQDETEFIIRKTPVKPAPQKFYYQTTRFNDRTTGFDTVVAAYVTKATDTFRLTKNIKQVDSLATESVPECSFVYSSSNDSVFITHGAGFGADKKVFLFSKKLNTTTKSNSSLAKLFFQNTHQTQTVVVMDTAAMVTIDTATYSCLLVIFRFDTTGLDYAVKIKGGGIFGRKRTYHIYTYCYLRNTDYLPVKMIETWPTPDNSDKEIPAWLVNKFWLLKYHT